MNHLQNGIELLRRVENEKAIKAFEKAKDDYPHDPEVYRHLGLAYSNIGKYSKALEYWNRCLNLDPQHHQTWWNLGQLYEILGDYEEAFSSYKKAEKTAHNEPAKAVRYKEWANKAKSNIENV